MSNEDNSFIRFNSDAVTALNYIPATNYVLAPHGSPIWEGSPDELAALVRDARRFRRMERAHDGPTNTAWCKAAHYRDGLFKQWDVVITPLAEIADALPEVEQK